MWGLLLATAVVAGCDDPEVLRSLLQEDRRFDEVQGMAWRGEELVTATAGGALSWVEGVPCSVRVGHQCRNVVNVGDEAWLSCSDGLVRRTDEGWTFLEADNPEVAVRNGEVLRTAPGNALRWDRTSESFQPMASDYYRHTQFTSDGTGWRLQEPTGPGWSPVDYAGRAVDHSSMDASAAVYVDPSDRVWLSHREGVFEVDPSSGEPGRRHFRHGGWLVFGHGRSWLLWNRTMQELDGPAEVEFPFRVRAAAPRSVDEVWVGGRGIARVVREGRRWTMQRFLTSGPVEDQDADGTPDALDRCPSTAETYNGRRDDDGCPDRPHQQLLYTFRTGHIYLGWSELIATEPPTLPEGRIRALDHLAALILNHRGIGVVRLSGPQNEPGWPDGANLAFVEQVASYLEARGVPRSRLEVVATDGAVLSAIQRRHWTYKMALGVRFSPSEVDPVLYERH